MKFIRVPLSEVCVGDTVFTCTGDIINVNMVQHGSDAVCISGYYNGDEGFGKKQGSYTDLPGSFITKLEESQVVQKNVRTMPKYMVILTDIVELEGDPDLKIPTIKTIKMFEMIDTLKMFLYDHDGASMDGTSYLPLVYEFVDGVPVERKYRLVTVTKTIVTDVILTPPT